MDPVSLLYLTLSRFLWIYSILLLIRVAIPWLFPNINWYDQPFSLLSQITDPYLNLFRGIIPPLGGLDFSPVLAFLLLNVVQSFALPLLFQLLPRTMGA